MSDVEFEGDNGRVEDVRFQSRRVFGKPATPKVVLVLMRYFHINKEKTAGNIIIGSLVVSLLLAGFIIYKTAIPHHAGKAKINQALPERVKSVIPQKQ